MNLEEIKKAINCSGLKQKRIAAACGITEVYLSYILNGMRPLTNNVRDKLENYFKTRKSIIYGLFVQKSRNTTKLVGIFKTQKDAINKAKDLKLYSPITNIIIEPIYFGDIFL